MDQHKRQWICMQLGSREHYAIPRILKADARLQWLFTDTWIGRRYAKAIARVHPALAGRREDGIPDKIVKHNSIGRMAMDASVSLRKLGHWEAIISRNEWFQKWAAKTLAGVLNRSAASDQVVYSYSYTARLPFREAKKRGLMCVLGQIDPGPLEAEAIKNGTSKYESLGRAAADPPEEYWAGWREEISLADAIIVNSRWSSELLIKAGVDANKLVEIPLALDIPRRNLLRRRYPAKFSSERPLRVLFRGQVILRKGIGQLFDAIRSMKGEAVEFTFAGRVGVDIPEDLRTETNVRILGEVPRSESDRLYSEADVFILPSLSEGFAITQLEALSNGLPCIVSTYCARVIEDGYNGIVINEVSAESIVKAVRRCVTSPNLLALMEGNCRLEERFTLEGMSSVFKTFFGE